MLFGLVDKAHRTCCTIVWHFPRGSPGSKPLNNHSLDGFKPCWPCPASTYHQDTIKFLPSLILNLRHFGSRRILIELI